MTVTQYIMARRARQYAGQIYFNGRLPHYKRQQFMARLSIDATLRLIAAEGVEIDPEALRDLLFAGRLLGVVHETDRDGSRRPAGIGAGGAQ